MTKYSTPGLKLHKPLFLALASVWICLMVASLAFRLHEIFHGKRPVLSLIPFCLLAATTVYIVYALRMTTTSIDVSEDGISYERGFVQNWQFTRITSFVSWPDVESALIRDMRQGPVIIQTARGDLIYWNSVARNDNDNLVQEVTKRITEKKALGSNLQRGPWGKGALG